jgi:hypothetical protein
VLPDTHYIKAVLGIAYTRVEKKKRAGKKGEGKRKTGHEVEQATMSVDYRICSVCYIPDMVLASWSLVTTTTPS